MMQLQESPSVDMTLQGHTICIIVKIRGLSAKHCRWQTIDGGILSNFVGEWLFLILQLRPT